VSCSCRVKGSCQKLPSLPKSHSPVSLTQTICAASDLNASLSSSAINGSTSRLSKFFSSPILPSRYTPPLADLSPSAQKLQCSTIVDSQSLSLFASKFSFFFSSIIRLCWVVFQIFGFFILFWLEFQIFVYALWVLFYFIFLFFCFLPIMAYDFLCFSYLVDLLYFDVGLRTFSLTYM
jgi:hypothetical protein